MDTSTRGDMGMDMDKAMGMGMDIDMDMDTKTWKWISRTWTGIWTLTRSCKWTWT
jgi:hypothetical protein